MIEQGQCEKCAALEREVAALKRERAELAAMVHSEPGQGFEGRVRRACPSH